MNKTLHQSDSYAKDSTKLIDYKYTYHRPEMLAHQESNYTELTLVHLTAIHR